MKNIFCSAWSSLYLPGPKFVETHSAAVTTTRTTQKLFSRVQYLAPWGDLFFVLALVFESPVRPQGVEVSP